MSQYADVGCIEEECAISGRHKMTLNGLGFLTRSQTVIGYDKHPKIPACAYPSYEACMPSLDKYNPLFGQR